MAARKSAKKPTTKKASAKKPAAKKTSPKRQGSGKRPATAAKSAPKRKPATKARAEKGGAAAKPASAEKAKKKRKSSISATSVNLGHVFALRPRVSTSFRQADFLTARHLLQDEAYESIEEAARAVAEKALEMTHEGPSKRGFRPGR
jgi:hypothetical protein